MKQKPSKSPSIYNNYFSRVRQGDDAEGEDEDEDYEQNQAHLEDDYD